MDATIRPVTLDCKNYFDKYALNPISSELSIEARVAAFAITFLMTLGTGGLFLVGLVIRNCQKKFINPIPFISPAPSVVPHEIRCFVGRDKK